MSKKEVVIEKKYKIVSYRKKTDGWTKIYNSSFEYIESLPAFKVYCYLCYRYNEDLGFASVSMSTIAKDCCMSKTTVQKAIKYLDNLKLIKKNTNKETNEYYIYYLTNDINIEGETIITITVIKGKSNKKDNDRRKYKYIKWRNDVLERDDYTCQLCGCCNDILNVHHIEKYSTNEHLRTDINNGITLCYNCHRKTIGREEEFKDYFKKIITNNKN